MSTSVIKYRNVEIDRKEVLVLKEINLEIQQGELVYLTGKVGSGKSSFLKSLYSEVPIASGKAEVLGYNLLKISTREIPMLRRQIGIVFQDFRLLPDRSVYDNLLFVLKATGWKDRDEQDRRIESVLKSVGMLNKSYKKPHELSGGEQQRVVMARAMLNNPKLLLADEPTGNLDPTTSEQLMELLNDASKNGTTVIVATHNQAMPQKYPGRIISLADHRMTELSSAPESIE